MKEQIEKVAQWIVHSKRVVVFAGAGLSTESGIPDFRSPGGVWDRYNPEDFYFQNFMASEASREKYWQMATEMYEPMKQAQPNLAHLAIADLERLGKLDCIITQNVDGLHHKAGNSEEKILQLHGTAMHVACMQCHKRYDREKFKSGGETGKRRPAATTAVARSSPPPSPSANPCRRRKPQKLISGPQPVTSSLSSVRPSLCSPLPLCLWWQNEMEPNW